MRKFSVRFALLIGALALFGCDDDGEGDADGGAGGQGGSVAPDPDEGETITQTITAAEGGTIATPSGSVQLQVPGGALAADTEITLEVKAAAAGTASSVYEFGPDGLQFQAPAQLAVAFDGNVPEGKEAVLAVEENGTWVALAGSSLAGGKVTAPVQHFSRFAVIIRDGEVVAVSECEDVVENFSPCGGDARGSWRFRDFCFSASPLGSDPFEGRCPDARIDAEYNVEGTLEVGADTVTVDLGAPNINIEYYVPLSCLGGATCEQAFASATCQTTADACECSQTQMGEDAEPSTDGYRIEGNEIIIIDAEDSEETRVPYCVQGNILTVYVADEDEDDPDVVWVLERQ